jgi:seryl-tRNA synthetase
MHDIKAIRENPQAFDAGLARRGLGPMAGALLQIDAAKRLSIQQTEVGQSRRKVLSQQFGTLKAKGETIPAELVAELESLKADIPLGEEAVARMDADLISQLAALPNIPADDVPDGADEDSNIILHERGTVPTFAFKPQEHPNFGPALGLDFESAQAVSGARFAYLRGGIARLSRALGAFMLDIHTTEFGYEEIAPPLLVREPALFGTGQLPKFAEDLFATQIPIDKDWVLGIVDRTISEMEQGYLHDLIRAGIRAEVFDNLDAARRRWLIPTSEVSLTNLVREKILGETELPLRFVALTPCFRSEAGAAGKDTRGLIRQHQFDKVELVSITTPDASDAEHERMTQAAETILDRLDLPYRRMLLCAGDMGFTARKTYDLEVWLPGQSAYREISSCSNCGDFQARRMNARYRKAGEKGTTFVHTLNGSGVAVGRALVAVLENYQEEDGSVIVPDALLPYMGGLTRLEP